MASWAAPLGNENYSPPMPEGSCEKIRLLGSLLPNAGEGIGGEGDCSIRARLSRIRIESLAFETKSPACIEPPHLQLHVQLLSPLQGARTAECPIFSQLHGCRRELTEPKGPPQKTALSGLLGRGFHRTVL